ncbi:unnamed protein product [Leptidea sinapis]|uniref:Uncharacterized protein n=1 Tax=Leptidea sinapis TaxID=189913 RepID=A0A5E4QS83_9NEOP|nr:unnamed protein product [Leptidea sinapis]
MSSIKIFMPIFPETINKIYFNGYVNNTKEAYIVIYITNYSATTTKIFKHIKPNENRIIGCCMNTVHQSQQTILTAWPNQLIIDTSETYKLSQLILNNKKILNSNIIVMQYDIHKVMNTETLDVNCNEFEQLKKYLVYDSNMPQTIEYKPLCTVPSWISSSMYIQHCCNQINLLNWLQNTVKRKGKVSLKQGNYIVALIIDILLGYIVLELFLFDRTKNGVLLVGILEKLVNYMYSLLKWLMGAPAGLKLNNAFNKMLGRYFSYHVELWWLFLGNIFIETNKDNSEHLLLQVKILNKPLREVIRISKPPVDLPKNVEWRSVVSSVLTGNQII